jgi:hypothetical protein
LPDLFNFLLPDLFNYERSGCTAIGKNPMQSVDMITTHAMFLTPVSSKPEETDGDIIERAR